MNAQATIALAPHGLELRCPAGNLREDRALADEDVRRFEGWAARYHAAIGTDGKREDLLAIGAEIYDWLNGPQQFLARLTGTIQAPLLIEFAAGRNPSGRERHFLDAPWELLAEGCQHWALREDIVFCPVRRIGKADTPPPAPPHRLGVLFMAAAPKGADNLTFEAEETTILTATRDIGLDLFVEESGTLERLAAMAAREDPDVIQLSCHGKLQPEPSLLLEDEIGDPLPAKASALCQKLADQCPRLLFLSACETAQADPVLNSLACSLVCSGAPAVLGWAAPVNEQEATVFAGELYRRLTAGDDLSQALAYARFGLANSDQRAAQGSRDWHLSRLYLGKVGGGVLAQADGRRRYTRGAIKAFLDARQQVPVAGEWEFVGRRRQIQAILRDFRAPTNERHAGVLIRGMERQGKSSLAARAARRLEHSHELVVIFGRYDAPAILEAFPECLATAEVDAIVQRHCEAVEENADNLLIALTELLEGPCRQTQKEPKRRPVLLVIDDFEQCARSPRHGPPSAQSRVSQIDPRRFQGL